MLLKQKLAKQLKAEAAIQGVEIEIYIDNISINCIKKGCSGHVINTATGSCVYVDTEGSCLASLSGKSMYRLAKDRKDWASNSLKNGYNRWIEDENLASSVISLLVKEKGEEK